MGVKGVLGGSLTSGVRNVVRYDQTNNQLYSDFYRRIGGGFWGYIGFDVSPSATFLPQRSLRGGIYRSLSKFELGAGFSYMKFRRSEVYLFIPTVVVYLPADLYYSGSLYYSVLRQTFTFLNRLYKKEGRFRWFLSLSAGTSSERLEAGEDFFRYRTFSAGGGAEYYIEPGLAFGGSLKYEDREGLYRRYGGEMYVRIAW